MKILVVDDERMGRESLQMVLKACAHQVQVAGDGHEALQHAESFTPEVALIDLHLGPPMDGLEVAQQLRERFDALRVILISGRNELDHDQFQRLDAHFLSKPFQLDELLPLLKA